jgi:hypothetical protein
MNGRACQLCGKPLSRIWAGSGGDFCSREHRNQYRLKCGMDTLLEANKHASLMRRRDQLRQFPAVQLQAGGITSPRACGPCPAVVHKPGLRHMRAPCESLRPALVAVERFEALLSMQESAAEPRAMKRAGSRPGRAPVLPAVFSRRAPVAIARAGLVGITLRRDGKGSRRRGFFAPPRNRMRVEWPSQPFRAMRLQQLGSLAMRRGRKLASPAKIGNPFRVSGSCAFRRPGLCLPDRPMRGPRASGMTWPVSKTLPRRTHGGAGQFMGASHRDMPLAAACGPHAPGLQHPPALRKPQALPLGNRPAYRGDSKARGAGSIWTTSQMRQIVPVPEMSLRTPPKGPGCLPVKVRPATGDAAHRLERARFQPPEQPWIATPILWNPSR